LSFWFLLQVIINLVMLAGLAFAFVRLNKPAKDDPRLSKGLQLLSSKIAVLEDLSDRTETQVAQLTALLDQKSRELQQKIESAEDQLLKIEQSTGKSLEVAKIFQDRIPHQEIIERQNTIKYVTAAKMAHQGYTKSEIEKAVDLSTAELDFLIKVNRDSLQFSEEDLPQWVKDQIPNGTNPDDFSTSNVGNLKPQSVARTGVLEGFSSMPRPEKFFEPAPTTVQSRPAASPEVKKEALRDLGEKFRAVKQDQPAVAAEDVQIIEREGKRPLVIKKVEFPRIQINDNLG
jgi:hypothetical protein